jgi:hypothetical protein
MAHFRCLTCRTRVHTPDSPADLLDETCPHCGSAFERVGDLAGLVGFRAITSHHRTAEASRARTPQSAVDRLGDLHERRALRGQSRLDGESWIHGGRGAAAEAVALPRPETTC